MDHPLIGSRIKLERGRAHLRALYEELGPAFQSPIEFDRQWLAPTPAPDRELYPVLEVFISEVQAIPVVCAAIVGDALCNLRSALDHLAWQLVLRSGGTPTNQVQFPLASSAEKFKGQSRRVAGMTAEMIDNIESLQPYDNREGPIFQALRHLRDLSNKDKHQVLNLVLMGLGQIDYDIRLVDCEARGVWLNDELTDRPLVAGTPVARFFITDRGRRADVRFDMKYGAYAALAEAIEKESIEHTLVRIALSTEGIVNRFAERFFST